MLVRHLATPSRLGALALGVGALGLAACTEPPNLELDWTVVGAENEALLCSEVGVATVRVTVERGGAAVETAEVPCIEGSAGLALEPGTYDLELEGLRRNGEPWPEPGEGEEGERVAHATASGVTVSASGLETRSFELLAPPQCDDGIDNDRDGRVDGSDPGCAVGNTEFSERSITLIELAVSFLGREVVRPDNLNVDYVEVQIDCVDASGDCQDEDPTTPDLDYPLVHQVSSEALDLEQWAFPLPLIDEALPAGASGFDYQLSIAVGRLGVGLLSSPYTEDFTVNQNQAVFVSGEYDFGEDEFLEPIELPARVVQTMLRFGGTTGQPCALGNANSTPIEELRLRVSDANDGDNPLDSASLGLSVPGVDVGEGWIAFECPPPGFQTGPLLWGAYGIELEARIGGEVCFELELEEDDQGNERPQPLAPQSTGNAQNLYLTHALVDGEVKPACVECSVDNDCDMSRVCDSGLCVLP